MSLASYPSIFSVYHRMAQNLLGKEVIIEEKVDGSQFSFGLSLSGDLFCRSKGANIDVDAPEGMFKRGVETVLSLKDKLTPGYTYRGEYLQKPKHNTCAYSRTPANNIILFDVDKGLEDYMSYGAKFTEAARLGLELVPLLGEVVLTDPRAQLEPFFTRDSVLGGVKIEGVVVKPVEPLFGPDNKLIIAKFVSEDFKEKHSTACKAANPSKADIIQELGLTYRTEARWRKAIQHLRDLGQLQFEAKDIPLVLQEITGDILKEDREDIKNTLFKWAWKQLGREVVKGAPEFYKNYLMEKVQDGN